MAKEYQVISVSERSAVSPSGAVEKMVQYRFRTTKGAEATVDVAERDLTVEKVRELITSRAKLLDATMD